MRGKHAADEREVALARSCVNYHDRESVCGTGSIGLRAATTGVYRSLQALRHRCFLARALADDLDIDSRLHR